MACRLVQCETPSPTIWSRWVQRSGRSRRTVESAEVVVVVVPERFTSLARFSRSSSSATCTAFE